MPSDSFVATIAPSDAAMVVVTTMGEGERAGCLVGFHSQSSIRPPRYAVWLSKANHTYRVGSRAEHLAVHMLTEHDRDIAELFGGRTGDEVDKFSLCEWESGPGGVPLLRRCPHHVVLRRSALLDEGGDHVLVVGEPVAAGSSGDFVPLRLSAVHGLRPGHDASERPEPPTERSRPLGGG